MTESKIREVSDEINLRAAEAGQDPEKLLEAITLGAALVDAADEARDTLRSLIKRAMLAGVDPQAFYDKPYTKSHVTAIYNDLRADHPDLPKLARGPRRRP